MSLLFPSCINPSAGFHSGVKDAIKGGGERRSVLESEGEELHNDRIFLQGGGNVMLFGRQLQYGDRGSSPW